MHRFCIKGLVLFHINSKNMAKIKLKFRPSSVAGKEGTLYYKVTHKQDARQISTKFKIFPCEWDKHLSAVVLPHADNERRNILMSIQAKVAGDLARLLEIIQGLDKQASPYHADDVVKAFNTTDGIGFIAYSRRLIAQMKAANIPIAEKYKYSLNKFVKFHGDTEVSFQEFNSQLMVTFEAWMKGKVTRNTSSFYMRCLHAIYNRAMEEGLVKEGGNPFHRVYTGVDKTQKRALPMPLIQKIKDCDLTDKPKMAYARDLFLLSFYFRGMSFIDMAYLTKHNIANGVLSYSRKKTTQPLVIKQLPKMNEIIRRYAKSCTGDYLLPILSETDIRKSRLQYKNESRKVNTQLKKLGETLNLPIKLTMYVARHSWATAAHKKNVPISVISQGLGHDSEKTTMVYLASIDTSEVDKANDLVLGSLV